MFSGDVTSDGWAGKILRGTREHLNRSNKTKVITHRGDWFSKLKNYLQIGFD